MKKLYTTIALAAVAAGAYAQGTLNLINGSGALAMSTNSLVANGGNGNIGVTQGSGYLFALFVDAGTPSSANPITGGWTYTGTTIANIANGAFNGGAATAITGLAQNAFSSVLLVGWSTDGGTYATWSQVSTALQSGNGLTGQGLQAGTYYGVSSIGNVEPGGGSPSLPVAHLFATSPTAQAPAPLAGFQLDLVPVPEPASMALVALGGASLLLFRRKK
jgi:hypothetical protein